MEFFVPPADGAAVVRVLVRRAAALVPRPRHPGRACCGCGPTTPTSSSHYSSGTSDVEFLFPWGWDELEGIANRSDYDLTQHANHSGERLDYFDQATGERYVPHVIEPAAGATRTMAAFLLAAYDEDEVGGETRTVLRLHPRLAPYKVAVLPLSKKDTLTPLAKRGLPHCCAERYMVRLRRDAVDRPPLPPPGRDRHAAGRHRRLRLARRPGGHDPRPRHDRAGAGATRRPGGSDHGAPGLLRGQPGAEGSASDEAQRGSGERSEAHAEPSVQSAGALRLRLRSQAPPPADGATRTCSAARGPTSPR